VDTFSESMCSETEGTPSDTLSDGEGMKGEGEVSSLEEEEEGSDGGTGDSSPLTSDAEGEGVHSSGGSDEEMESCEPTAQGVYISTSRYLLLYLYRIFVVATQIEVYF